MVNISFPSLPPILQLLLVGRWFCEGSELHSSPDIQILWDGGDLHSLIIAEAFEDDTGRYTCLAANPSGSDSTSAEVFIEGTQGRGGRDPSLLINVVFPLCESNLSCPGSFMGK